MQAQLGQLSPEARRWGWLSVSTRSVFGSLTLIHSDDPYWCKNNWANCHRKRGYGDGSAWVQRIVTAR